ncbi:MAG: gliding motility-associated C-terminal domain-containing protein [Saprospiraceae bacterium]
MKHLPNGFSPNDDSINDYFTFFGNVHEIKKIEIFDRWGNLVYSEKNLIVNKEIKLWNGTFKGQNCLPGVYVFYSEIEFERGGEKSIQGEITLVK